MEINNQCVVALTWTLKDTLGELLDQLDDPVEFLVGGDDLFASIEAALQGHSAGAKVELHLEPEQAFGEFDEQLVFLEARGLYPDSIEEGLAFEGHALPAGTSINGPKELLYTVTEIYPEHVVLDGNHPLAGIALRLNLSVRAVREATQDEIDKGTAGTGFFKLQVTPARGDAKLH